MIYIVSQDGSGDFTGVQQAVDAVPAGSTRPTVILIRAGEYRERVIVNKDRLRLIGEDRDRTVIAYNACAKDRDEAGNERGTFLSFTLLVTGRDVEVENLTVKNDAGDGREVGQAVAVYAAGDRGVWRGCRFLACQDTLFCGPVMPKVKKLAAPRELGCECVDSVGDCPVTASRQYFENCFIRGDVDFIFGPYRCWFEKCTLHMNARGGFYTAANTPEKQEAGMVFSHCVLTGDCGPGEAFLGRPWRAFARTVFLKCEMREQVAPEGFRDWDEKRVITRRCAEYASFGPGAAPEKRNSREHLLTPEEASLYSVSSILGGADLWRPDRRVPTWFLCGDSLMADYPDSRFPMTGWGQTLQSLMPFPAYVENCAVNGRSSKSFVAEARLGLIELCLRPGDRLVIGFGHNDEKPDRERSTDPHTTFPDYLDLFIDAARRRGAEPVLVTPVVRRAFDENGVLLGTHGAYPNAVRALTERRGARLVDLERLTARLVSALGPEGSKSFFCHVPAGTENYPDGLSDNSHLKQGGAAAVARLFLDALSDTAPEKDGALPPAGPAPSSLLQKEDRVLGNDFY